MRKIVWIIFVGFFFFGCGAKKKTQNVPKYAMGWYLEVEKNETSGMVKDAFMDKVYHIQSEPVLTISDFKTMQIEKPTWGGREQVIIGIRLNDDVKEKWADLTERMSKTDEKVLFIYKNEVLANLSAQLRIENGNAMIAHERLSEKELRKIIKTIHRKR